MPKTNGLTWEIHPFNLFRLFRSTEEDGGQHYDHLKAFFLLQVSESGRAEDNFRFSIEGDVNIEVDFWGEDLLATRSFKPFSFSLETRPEDIDMRRNSLSSSWIDFQQAISEGTILVHKKDSNNAAREEFLAIWESEKAKNPNFGSAVRWAILHGLRWRPQTRPPRDARNSLHTQEGPPAIMRLRSGRHVVHLGAGRQHGDGPPLEQPHPHPLLQERGQDGCQPQEEPGSHRSR